MKSLESLASAYARWRASQLGRITDALERDLILELIGRIDGKQVLDVGCGDGVLSFELARRGANVTGLDADPTMIAAARKRGEAERVSVRLVEGHVERLPFADASHDIVVAVTVLCFVPDASAAVAEMARVLRPDGRLVVGELGRWSLWAGIRRLRGWFGSPTWRSATFRSASELRALVGNAGLVVEAVRGAIFYPPVGAFAHLFVRVDAHLGRLTSFGAAFVAICGVKSRQGCRATMAGVDHKH